MNFKFASAALAACALASITASGFFTNPRTGLAEFRNEITGHYTLLQLDEASIVDNGGAGPGWHRTGHYIAAWWVGFGRAVCRFYSPGWNTHFLTADPAECTALRQPGSGWTFEGERFAAGSCGPEASVPVHRLYNNRFAFGDVNHRYTADPAVRDAMVARGWTYEGVAFCTDHAGVNPEKSFLVHSGSTSWDQVIVPKAQCAARPGPCLASDQLAPLPRLLSVYLPPSYIERNPQYPAGVADIIGGDEGWIVTAAGTPEEVAARTFAQIGYSRFGLHVNGRERLAGPYAGLSPMQTLPGAAPAAGAADERVFPWRQSLDRRLTIGAYVLVKTLRRDEPGAHAYGHPIIQFADARGGRSFYLTLQAFGTVPPGDFVGPHAVNGWAIVSTVFRDRPAFGERLAGSFAACDPGSGGGCIPERTQYKFQLRRGDFQEVLRRARSVDPALSADAADYFVAAFGFQVETYLDARVGATLDEVKLDLMEPDRPGND
jgi:hypothetical protein